MDDRTLTVSEPGSGWPASLTAATKLGPQNAHEDCVCGVRQSRVAYTRPTLVHAANAAIAGPPALRDVGKFVPGRVSPRASPVAVFLTSHKRPRLVSTA